MASGLPISKETFHALQSPEAKLDALFEVLVHMNSSGYECEEDREKRLSKCEERFVKLEKRKWSDRGLSGAMGAVTGFLAGLLK